MIGKVSVVGSGSGWIAALRIDSSVEVRAAGSNSSKTEACSLFRPRPSQRIIARRAADQPAAAAWTTPASSAISSIIRSRSSIESAIGEIISVPTPASR